MKLIFNSVHIENFLSFKLADINLNQPGYTSVIGINNNTVDGAASNGAGKTAIFEAINWCLCGETIRGTKDVKNCYTNDGALVELNFLADDKSFKLIRTKEHSKYKTNLKIFINNEDKSGKGIRDSEKLLEQYLPDINSSLIGSVIILGQGLPQRFTNNTPSGRKEVLETLSKSDFMIKDLKDRIVIRKELLSKKVREYEDTLLQLKTKKSLLETQLADKESQLHNLECFNKEEVEQRIQFIDAELEKIQKCIDNANSEIDKKTTDLDNITESISKLAIEHVEQNKKISEKFDITSLLVKQADLSSKVRTLKIEINKLESITDICPTCGQKLPNVTKIDTTEKRSELDQLTVELSDVDKQVSESNAQLQENLDSEVKKFDENKKQLEQESSTIRQEISNKRSSISNYVQNQTSYNTEKINIRNKLNDWQKDLDTCKDNIKEYQLQLKHIEENILYNNIELGKTNEHLDIVNKFYSVITRDFRGYLLSNIISFIDSRAKKYSEQLFDNTSLEFKLEGNNISIYHAERQYENLSGGERQKVDIIVQFALRDMLCKYLNFSSNILVLDELTDNLDSKGCDKLFNLISSNLNDVESIYIISHHSDYALPIDNELIVRKGEDSISYIE